MKSNELMIGDWVLVNGVPRQVSQITKHKIGYHRAELPFGECKMSYAKLVEIKPIPLTAEILEKNGWEHDRIFMETRADENTHFSWTDRYGAVLYQNNYYMCDCKDVHTLQHALHLCGLAELANNFKV